MERGSSTETDRWVYWALNGHLDKCKVYDIQPEQSESFKSTLEAELGIDTEIMEKSDDLLTNSDIIIAATTNTTPLFDGDQLPEGVHISSIGAHSPTTRELDAATITRANLVVADYKPACMAEAGDFIIPINDGLIDESKIVSIGDIILGNISGRSSDMDISVFKSVGLAVQDVAVAKAVYDKAITQDVGQEIDF